MRGVCVAPGRDRVRSLDRKKRNRTPSRGVLWLEKWPCRPETHSPPERDAAPLLPDHRGGGEGPTNPATGSAVGQLGQTGRLGLADEGRGADHGERRRRTSEGPRLQLPRSVGPAGNWAGQVSEEPAADRRSRHEPCRGQARRRPSEGGQRMPVGPQVTGAGGAASCSLSELLPTILLNNKRL